MTDTLTTQCCIAGGGPAGLMLGFLLARAGVDTIVLEKHPDFLRDFRGDTIHPSTLEIMHELGLLEEFLTLPHQKVETLNAYFGSRRLVMADLRSLPVQCGFIAMMPQWDFLNFLAARAKLYPTFRLMMRAKAKHLMRSGDKVTGVDVDTPEGRQRIAADLVIGADGRDSTVRAEAGLVATDFGAPMDVFWFRLPRLPNDPDETAGYFGVGHILVLLNRGDYWQSALVIPKGGADALRARGLDRLRRSIRELAPFLADRVAAIQDWDAVKLLTVTLDRLETWYRDGLLCIGDAAHAMSPIGGVGVNIAVQDAVATANLLWKPLRAGTVTTADLKRVQDRRTFPARVTQRLQLAIQNRIISAALQGGVQMSPPLFLRAMNAVPLLRRIPARLLGLGVRPEHISSPELSRP
ncbi:MAG: FAD-dependent oxidoreductase [Rhodospirillaceae bacterium]|nr:FAD-dependent oxidoreductase [Rhodospirillaceae bacterium]